MRAFTASEKQLALIVSLSVLGGALGRFGSAMSFRSEPVEAASIRKLGDAQIDILYVRDIRLLTAAGDCGRTCSARWREAD